MQMDLHPTGQDTVLFAINSTQLITNNTYRSEEIVALEVNLLSNLYSQGELKPMNCRGLMHVKRVFGPAGSQPFLCCIYEASPGVNKVVGNVSVLVVQIDCIVQLNLSLPSFLDRRLPGGYFIFISILDLGARVCGSVESSSSLQTLLSSV